MRKSTVKSAIWIVAAAIIGLAGCGKPSSTGGSADGGTPAGKKFKIVYIPKNTGNPYFDDIINGFKNLMRIL